MSTIHRFPILIWQDVAGQFTACVAIGDGIAAVGRTRTDAREQLADYLDWSFRKYPWQAGPDCHESELKSVKVLVRPEYQQDDRRYPCHELVLLRIPSVVSRQSSGMFACSAPTVGVQFYFHDRETFVELLTHYVQQQLEKQTPRQLSRFAEPPVVELDEIVIRVPWSKEEVAGPVRPPKLESVAESLHERTVRRQFGAAWRRDDDVKRLAKMLAERNASLLIVGPPGSGKTTVLIAAIQQAARLAVASDEDAAPPHKHRFWLTSAARLMAGMKYLGQWEARCEEIIRELRQIEGSLCIENLLDLIRGGGESPQSSVAAFFSTYMQRGELSLIAEATAEELDACRRLLPGLVDQFAIVKLPPLDRADAVAVLDQMAAEHERNRKISIERGVSEQIVYTFERFMPYFSFPGRAVAFLADLYEQTRREKRQSITLDDALRFIGRRTGLADVFLRDDLRLDPDAVCEKFERRVIGQRDACRAVTNLVTTFKTGLNDPKRPIGVLLFCGPTGVGKTELAKSLADYFFGHGEQQDRLLRLDMSEYAAPGSGDRLIARSDGTPSQLIQRFRQQPFQVLLLDEIEKAHPVVFDVLMNLFDEGRLTDRLGRVTNFRSAVIVMTSNLGASNSPSVGFSASRSTRYVDEALAFFRPEFFNRIDEVVSFSSLDRDTILSITRKELAEVADREGLRAFGLRLRWTDSVVEHLAAAGFDSLYGARPLQRILEEQLVVPLAKWLLQSPVRAGGEIKITVCDQELRLERE